MSVASLQSLGFPFVVEPVPLARVQLWTQFARRSSELAVLRVVSEAFGGLYWEAEIVDSVQYVVGAVEAGNPWLVVSWLDSLLACVSIALRCWSEVVRCLVLPGEGTQADRWYQDARARVDFLTPLPQMVAEYIALCCDQYQLPLPFQTERYFERPEEKDV